MNPEAAPAMDKLLDIPGGARTAVEMQPMATSMSTPTPTGVPVAAGNDEEPF